jgi:hypothetical protein
MVAGVKVEAKAAGFASVSEFFRYLVGRWNNDRLAKEFAHDDVLFEQGKGIRLKSVEELDK